MSSDLITYLNYITGLENATDQQIRDIINERAQFILIGKSADFIHSANGAIDGVFDTIDKLAKQLEEEEIADESVKLAEDAAAVASIWSFGLGMAAFAALAVTDMALQYAIKKKEDDLNNHLASADKDIGDKVGGSTAQYIDLFKKNNNFIKASSPKGLTPQTARSYLYNFMDYLDLHAAGGVTLANFKKYIEVARITKNDANISKIYDILDKFTLSDDHGAAKIKEALDNMAKTGFNNTQCLQMVRNFTYAIWMNRMNVSSEVLREAATEAESIPPEETEASIFENMDAVGKFTAGLTIVMSIVDAVLNVYSIVETVKRYEKNSSVLRDARGQYKAYYEKLYDASKQYQPKSS